jgi:hypothetical protein
MTLSKYHGGTKLPRTLHRGGTKPEATTSGFHTGSGRPLGQLHEAPTRPQANDQNYGGQKVMKRK